MLQAQTEVQAAANIVIVPLEIRDFLEKMLDIPGVVMAGVPGAGGNDAIYTLHLKQAEEVVLELFDRERIARLEVDICKEQMIVEITA